MITDKDHVYITIQKQFKLGKIKLTQEYVPSADIGHYTTIIEDSNGNIIYSTSTCCGAPHGKINMKNCNDFYKDFRKTYK
jgi:hypothetical protein